MRKPPLPASSVAPALRRRTASAREPEAPPPRDSASSSDANSQGEPLPLPESKSGSSGSRRPEEARPPSSLPAAAPERSPAAAACAEESLGTSRRAACEGGAMLHVFPSVPTQMDYKGQKLAEQIFQGIILFSAVIGFIYGYITEQFGWTVYIVMGGFAVSCLLTLPPWPIYRRNPLKWLPVQEVATDEKKPADRKVKRHPKN